MNSVLRLASALVPEAMSPVQRWDRICQAVGEAHIASHKGGRAQTEAGEYLAGEAYDAACDTILQLILAPEATRMMTEAREFLAFHLRGPAMSGVPRE